jgi:hypothetical protein
VRLSGAPTLPAIYRGDYDLGIANASGELQPNAVIDWSKYLLLRSALTCNGTIVQSELTGTEHISEVHSSTEPRDVLPGAGTTAATAWRSGRAPRSRMRTVVMW